jgi:uncharacterized protein (DUF849 family)
MDRATIITVAVTGNITRPDQHPNLPITPAQIAAACLDSEAVGASIAHIHVRDPKTGGPSMDLALYREVVDRLRDAGSRLIINLTTGPGGRFVPSEDEPRVAGPGTTLLAPMKRIEHVLALKPEICTLDLNTMFSGASVVINTPRNLRIMAEAIRAAGVMPELEVFDSGDIHLGRDLLEDGVLASPPLFQIVLGIKYGFSATSDTLRYARSLLPDRALWAAFGVGRAEFPIVGEAFLMGGHVRVGMEDNLYLSRGQKTPGNAALVERAAAIVRSLGGTIATPDDARRLLGLPARPDAPDAR